MEVSELSRHIVNAGFSKDEVLRAGLLGQLIDYIDNLIATYGPHPELIETKADFMESAADRHKLYRSALEIAETRSLPILSICLSYAQLLLDEHQIVESCSLLKKCEIEAQRADKYDRRRWNALFSECCGRNE
jgi:hypothetical protein